MINRSKIGAIFNGAIYVDVCVCINSSGISFRTLNAANYQSVVGNIESEDGAAELKTTDADVEISSTGSLKYDGVQTFRSVRVTEFRNSQNDGKRKERLYESNFDENVNELTRLNEF